MNYLVLHFVKKFIDFVSAFIFFYVRYYMSINKKFNYLSIKLVFIQYFIRNSKYFIKSTSLITVCLPNYKKNIAYFIHLYILNVELKILPLSLLYLQALKGNTLWKERIQRFGRAFTLRAVGDPQIRALPEPLAQSRIFSRHT